MSEIYACHQELWLANQEPPTEEHLDPSVANHGWISEDKDMIRSHLERGSRALKATLSLSHLLVRLTKETCAQPSSETLRDQLTNFWCLTCTGIDTSWKRLISERTYHIVIHTHCLHECSTPEWATHVNTLYFNLKINEKIACAMTSTERHYETERVDKERNARFPHSLSLKASATLAIRIFALDFATAQHDQTRSAIVEENHLQTLLDLLEEIYLAIFPIFVVKPTLGSTYIATILYFFVYPFALTRSENTNIAAEQGRIFTNPSRMHGECSMTRGTNLHNTYVNNGGTTTAQDGNASLVALTNDEHIYV